MITARQEIGSGEDGTEYTLALLTQWKNYFGTLPAIRAAALRIAGSARDDDRERQVARLERFVKTALVYQADPVGSELIHMPDVLLLAIARDGTAHEDCDGHVLLFCALAESLGIACSVAGVSTPGSDRINHVIAVVHLPGRDVDIDLCAKQNWRPVYGAKLIVG